MDKFQSKLVRKNNSTHFRVSNPSLGEREFCLFHNCLLFFCRPGSNLPMSQPAWIEPVDLFDIFSTLQIAQRFRLIMRYKRGILELNQVIVYDRQNKFARRSSLYS